MCGRFLAEINGGFFSSLDRALAGRLGRSAGVVFVGRDNREQITAIKSKSRYEIPRTGDWGTTRCLASTVKAKASRFALQRKTHGNFGLDVRSRGVFDGAQLVVFCGGCTGACATTRSSACL